MKIPALRSSVLIAAVLLLNCLRGYAADPWLTNYQQAVGEAKAEKKNILLNFTGSDWCPVCIAMDKEVFSTQQFKDYAAKNLVLLTLDFPVSKPQPPQLHEQNSRLEDAYGVGDLFPVFILIDKDGKVLVRHIGRVDGGASGFIAMLEGKKV
jgi:thiol-disulfide isomerase/thioredoxin